jgi:hypothetical protein
MANTNSPFGLRLLGVNSGGTPSFNLITATIDKDDTQVAYRGDGMESLTTGYVHAITAAGTAASQWAGIFWGCEYLSTALGRRVQSSYWPGSDAAADVTAYLIPLSGHPAVEFVAQATSTAIAFEDIGENVDIGYAAGTAYTGWAKSGTTIAQSTLGTGATLPFRIVDLWSNRTLSGEPGTDDTSSYNWVVVRFNSLGETGNA